MVNRLGRWSGFVMPIVVRDPRVLAALTIAGFVPLFAFAAANVGGQAALWENAHWTLASLAAVLLATAHVRGATGATRRVRLLGVAGLLSYFAGSVVWDIQIAAGAYLVPAPSDVLFLAIAVPLVAALLIHARGTVSRGELVALALDGATVTLAVTTAVLFVYEPIATGASPALGAILLAYPIVFLGLAALAAMAALAQGVPIRAAGPGLAAVGLAATGVVWVIWIAAATEAFPVAGSPLNALSSIAIIVVGAGVATWHVPDVPAQAPDWHGPRPILVAALPVIAVMGTAAFVIVRSSERGTDQLQLVDISAWAVVALAIIRQTLLLRERTWFVAEERRAVDRERGLRAEAQRALAPETASEQRYRQVVAVFAQFGEQLTFAADEPLMLSAAATAARTLYPVASGEILLLNESRDRLVVALGWGTCAREAGSIPDIDSPLSCFGLRRSAPYLVGDVADPLAVACPALPATQGAVLCVPMISHGQPVGVIHLATGSASGIETEHAARIAEQLALAIANARLFRTMENLALTDPLTGLYNSRFFDPYAERELANAERAGEPVGIVMIDLDHFKQFNDTHGHPAGDEALRTFARTASEAVRRSDTLARYGGEEFVLLVRDADLETSSAVAEKVRAAVEAMTVDLGPGRSGRLTASFGVASSAAHGTDRRVLIRTADRALYEAKRSGRNRVAIADHDGATVRARSHEATAS